MRMKQRISRVFLAFALTLVGSSGASAQDGLGGVTMRVLDDLGDIDAVVIELDADGSEDAERRRADGGAARDSEREAAPGRQGEAARDASPEPNEREAERRERSERETGEALERSEGALEDRDVEREPSPTTP
jgi:hypothetical protein